MRTTATAGAAMLTGSVLGAWSGLSPVVLAALAAALGMLACVARPLRCLGWSAAGLLLTCHALDAELERRWPMAREQQRVLLELRIDSLLGERGGAWVGDGEMRILRPDGEQQFTRRVRFDWPMRGTAPRAGETWQLLMRLAPPRARLNPGGLDMERQWLRERVQVLGRVLESRLNRRLQAAPRGLLAWRESIATNIRSVAMDRDAGALFAALAVGATAHMTSEQWRVFNATGTTHLVAISGLHVTLFAWLAAHAARRLWRWLAWAGVPVMAVARRESFALLLGLLAAFGYSLLAGFSIPAQRTLLMLAAYVAARSAARSVSVGDLLGAACIGVLLLDPLAPLAAGFWLSFGAMAALLAAPGRSAIVAQAWLAVALVPLTLVIFGGVSVAGWLANFAAIPLFSFVLVPLALLAAATSMLWPAAAALSLAWAERVHDIALPALTAMANMPLALWQGHATPVWYAASGAALLVLRLSAPWHWRATAVLIALPLAVGRGSDVAANTLQMSVLDAGSGLAVLIRTSRHALVYDTGEVWGSDGGAVLRDLAPLLRAEGLRRLDLLVLSRADHFQVAGAARLLSLLEIGAGYTGGSWRSAPVPIEACPAQRRWRWDGVDFQLRSTQGSCELRVMVGGRTVWLAPQRQVVVTRRGAASAEWILASRRRTSDADLARLAGMHGLESGAVLATDRTGAIGLAVSAAGRLRWFSLIDPIRAPLWRLPREPLPGRVSDH